MMTTSTFAVRSLRPALLAATLLAGASAHALPINWTDWQRSIPTTAGFAAAGTITSGSSTVGVQYQNPNGIAFFQTGAAGEPDWWTQGFFGAQGRDPARSPYTSTGPTGVDNIPTGTDMIGLQFAGTQTLAFSEAIANPVFSYISLNANGYAFDQDFDILSFGDGTDNDIGFWGAGTSSKDIVDLGGGNFEYRLVGTGEPHGTIRFKGTFNAVSWRSLSNEFWNGFTVGIQGTAIQVCDIDPTTPGCRQNVPEPAMWALLSLGAFGIGYQRKQRDRS